MLEFKLIGSDLTVIERLHSFTETRTSFWYYNIDTWCKNRNGKENEPIDLECDQRNIDWVKKHYFPRVGLEVNLTEKI
jgi:hypothetical protein